jgi:hypothetical protein
MGAFQQMTVTPNLYAKARFEILALFGWNADSLSPDQVLRVDCATALRCALDVIQGQIVRGESIDVARMLTASEALARLLPPAALATPPAEEHGDPRIVMWEIYKTMRERGEIGQSPEGDSRRRIAALEGENQLLRARLASSAPLEVPTSDIVPPSEIGVARVGLQRGPDDPRPKPPVTIDAQANPAAPRNWDDTDNGREWQAWVDAGGGSGSKYWGPA